jgi:hypothetical protein
VQVTEWEAPRIPQDVLDSIEREAVDTLEGEWGNPKAAAPIQVDVLDLETDTDVVSIEVFNRAIFLTHEDSEEIRRIHRVCGVLDAAASGGPDQSGELTRAATALTVIRRADVLRPAAATFDLASVLKEHRRQPGICDLCGTSVTRTNAAGHMRSCALAHDPPSGPLQRLLHLRATSPGQPAYWLDVEARADAKLEALDSFLRGVWLECCGHLSAFRIGTVTFFSRGYEFGAWAPLGGLGRQRPVERRMNARMGDVLPPAGERCEYEYDFGSSTLLEIKVIAERTGRLGRSPVRLAVRNVPPVWPCAVCGEPATFVCAYCRDGDGDPFVCADHQRDHACGEDEGFLPVVNSPRMGVCGYGGES